MKTDYGFSVVNTVKVWVFIGGEFAGSKAVDTVGWTFRAGAEIDLTTG